MTFKKKRKGQTTSVDEKPAEVFTRGFNPPRWGDTFHMDDGFIYPCKAILDNCFTGLVFSSVASHLLGPSVL